MEPREDGPRALEGAKRVARLLDIAARIGARPKAWTRRMLARTFWIGERRIQQDLELACPGGPRGGGGRRRRASSDSREGWNVSRFSAHRLSFECRVESPILLGEQQGSAIRGALFHALRGRRERPGFCVEPGRQDCRGCRMLAGCPVSFLLATVDEAGRRGADVPRPYTVEPPLGASPRYEPGEPFRFGLTVFARALALFPYVVVAARRLEEEGIGRRSLDGQGRWRPGRFRIERIVAVNPLTGEGQVVLQRGDDLVSVPSLPVTHEQVLARSRRIAEGWGLRPVGQLGVEFLTPTRVVDGGRDLRRPAFRPLFQRLVERLSSLWEEYGREELPIDFGDLMARAEGVRLVADGTRWLEVRGYSTRQGAPKYLSGFVGRAAYEGDLGVLLPWLVWGELTHVGKDAVKGCGLYRVEGPPAMNGAHEPEGRGCGTCCRPETGP